MRKIYDFQSAIDRIPPDEIKLDLTSRDDTIKYLVGFLAILLDADTRAGLILEVL